MVAAMVSPGARVGATLRRGVVAVWRGLAGREVAAVGAGPSTDAVGVPNGAGATRWAPTVSRGSALREGKINASEPSATAAMVQITTTRRCSRSESNSPPIAFTAGEGRLRTAHRGGESSDMNTCSYRRQVKPPTIQWDRLTSTIYCAGDRSTWILDFRHTATRGSQRAVRSRRFVAPPEMIRTKAASVE
jgi:hypothetical protein